MTQRRVRRVHHDLRPDYTRPPLEVPDSSRERILDRLERLYGAAEAQRVWPELDRILRVHHAHKPPHLVEMDRGVDPTDRFTERDCMLITYGDLLVGDGSRSPLATLDTFLQRPGLKNIFNTLHILPFFPYSSDRGFAVVDFKAVDPELGSWQDIAAIGEHYELMFDGVLNHASSVSEPFQEFLNGNPHCRDIVISFASPDELPPEQLRLVRRPRTSDLLTEFCTIEGPRWVWTTFSPDQVDLNYRNPAVLLWSIATLLQYIRRGADIVRLDAVTYIWTELGTTCASLEETHEVIKLYRDVVDLVEPRAALLTETNVPHDENVSYFGNGRDEAHMVYNFALPPLMLHSFYTGDATALSGWAEALAPPSDTTTFLNILDTHDGIGVLGAKGILSSDQIEAMIAATRENGAFVSHRTYSDGSEKPYELNTTWYGALNREDSGEDTRHQVRRFVASKAAALALRGVPGMYFHGVLGTGNDPEVVRRSGHKRDINRQVVHLADLERDLADPNSRLSLLREIFAPIGEARISERAFHPHGGQRVLHLTPEVFALLRISPEGTERVLAITNVADRDVRVRVPATDLGSEQKAWRALWGGASHGVRDGHLDLALEPYDVCWLKAL